MGIFDKVEQDAEDMMRDDPKVARQASQLGGGQLSGGQLGWDMQAAQNMIGQQRGAQGQGQGRNQGDSDQDASDQGQD